MPGSLSRIRTFIGAMIAAAAAAGFAADAGAQPVTGLTPAEASQIDGAKPGLGVRYLFAKFNGIDEIEEMATWSKPKVGTPLPMLNYNVGPGAVLSTTAKDLVGAFIDGYIRFEQTGTFIISVQYNDGVRLSIGGKQIYEDPIVAPDRFSPNLEVQIDEAGWYPISLIYYEKKSTSTLELYWQLPGAEEFVFVPASAFSHTPLEGETS